MPHVYHMPVVLSFPTIQMTGKSSFVDETDGTLLVSFEDRRFQPSSLQSVLSSFGELLSFEAADAQELVSISCTWLGMRITLPFGYSSIT